MLRQRGLISSQIGLIFVLLAIVLIVFYYQARTIDQLNQKLVGSGVRLAEQDRTISEFVSTISIQNTAIVDMQTKAAEKQVSVAKARYVTNRRNQTMSAVVSKLRDAPAVGTSCDDSIKILVESIPVVNWSSVVESPLHNWTK